MDDLGAARKLGLSEELLGKFGDGALELPREMGRGSCFGFTVLSASFLF